jgi:hypothetical protein
MTGDALSVTGTVTVLAATDTSPPTIRLSYSYPVADLGWAIHANLVLAENRPISAGTYGLADVAPQSQVVALDRDVGRHFALHNLGGDGTMSLVITSASPAAVHGSLLVNLVATTSGGPRPTMLATF